MRKNLEKSTSDQEQIVLDQMSKHMQRFLRKSQQQQNAEEMCARNIRLVVPCVVKSQLLPDICPPESCFRIINENETLAEEEVDVSLNQSMKGVKYEDDSSGEDSENEDEFIEKHQRHMFRISFDQYFSLILKSVADERHQLIGKLNDLINSRLSEITTS